MWDRLICEYIRYNLYIWLKLFYSMTDRTKNAMYICVLAVLQLNSHLSCVGFESPHESRIYEEQLSPVAQCVVRRAPICSNAYGGWFAPCPRHRERLTYRPSAALQLSGALDYPTTNFCRPLNGSLSLTASCDWLWPREYSFREVI